MCYNNYIVERGKKQLALLLVNEFVVYLVIDLLRVAIELFKALK